MPFTAKAFQGITTSIIVQVVLDDGTAAVNVFDGTEPLEAYVWPGDSQAVTFQPTVSWNSGPLGTINLTFDASSTATIVPGFYEIVIKLADDSAPLAYGYLNLDTSPGTATADLATVPYVRAALSEVQLSQDQVEYLPYCISAASDFIRRWCGDRDFTQKDYTCELIPALDGMVRLPQTPINQVIRVQGGRDSAMTIAMNAAGVTAAWVNWSYTGDVQSGITITGVDLYSEANGVQTHQNVLFSALSPPTVASLVSAINALTSPSWSALASDGYGGWPVTELIGGEIGQGAMSGSGVSLDVYSQDLSGCRLYSRGTGMLEVGYQNASVGFGPRWGYDWSAFDLPSLDPGPTKVKVRFNAGYATIPAAIQQAVAEVARGMIARLRRDPTAHKERLGEYEYILREVWPSMSMATQQALSLYRYHNA